ncbi:MAG: LamG domain-containing protein [Deltaproteobacteria bacterium]
MKIKVFTVCAVVFLFCGIVNAGINDWLIAYYPFNGNANDESGNGNNGIVHGAILTSDRFGNANSAYYFDGINSGINAPATSILSVSNLTLSAWVNTKGGGTWYPRIIAVGPQGTSYQYYAMNLSGPGPGSLPHKLGYLQNWDSGDNYYVATTSTVSDMNAWNHVAVTYDGSNVKFYFNGMLVTTSQYRHTIRQFTTALVQIGYSDSGTDRYNGSIDDIRIYNRTLSDSEVQQLYSGASPSVIVKPYTFTSGTPAKAAEVNADLDILYQQINVLRTIVCADHPTANGCQ